MHSSKAYLLFLYAFFITLVSSAAIPEPNPEAEPEPVPNPPPVNPPQPPHPPPNEVWIESVKWAGSGCPAGSVSASFSSDAQIVNLAFDDYVAEVGPGLPPSKSRKNCHLNIKLHFPKGWSYTVYTTDYRGFVQLDKGVKGTQKSTYYFAGETTQLEAWTTWVGPKAGKDYLIRDTFARSALVWCPCGASTTLNINTQLRLDASGSYKGKGKGLLTTDSINHKVTHKYGLWWKRC